MTKRLAEQLQEARARVAEIELEMYKHIKGKVVSLVEGSEVGIEDANYYKVIHVDSDIKDDRPIKISTFDGSDRSWVSLSDVEIVEYDRVRELLLADVDRQLNEMFAEGADD